MGPRESAITKIKRAHVFFPDLRVIPNELSTYYLTAWKSLASYVKVLFHMFWLLLLSRTIILVMRKTSFFLDRGSTDVFLRN